MTKEDAIEELEMMKSKYSARAEEAKSNEVIIRNEAKARAIHFAILIIRNIDE